MEEEGKNLKSVYSILRATIYIMLFLEIMVFVPFDFLKGKSVVHLIFAKISNFSLYDNLIYSKLSILLVTVITCIGTVPRKKIDFDPQRMLIIPFLIGICGILLAILCYPNVVSFKLFGLNINFVGYIIFSIIGTMCFHSAMDNMSKYIKTGLMKDRMNWDEEAFMQETKKIENPHSVNIPTKFYYKGKMRSGWINIEQPFRGIWVVGVPGSGKTFGIIEPLIRQQSAKGYSMAVYDYKFPTLARKLFYHFEKNKLLKKIPENASFNIINFVDVEYSKRINPIQNRYITSVGEASETAITLIEALKKGSGSSGGNDEFFRMSAENLLAACIYFFVNYNILPYDKDWNILTEKKFKTKDGKIICKYFNKNNEEKELYRWKGQYADLPHVLAFLQLGYQDLFDVLLTDDRIASLTVPFKSAYENKAFDQLEGMAGSLRIYVSRLVTPESYFVLSGDDFDIKISDPNNISYLLIANDPKMEQVISALNAVIINRLVSEVNTGEGKNNPVSIIVDELPTVYFNKIDRLQGTARSNKVAVALGFQSSEQLKKDYGDKVSSALLNIFGNVVCAASCGKDTVEWLSNDILGKIKQIKKGVSISRADTTISLNEELMPLVPPEKIANMPQGWLCGMTAKSYSPLKVKSNGKINLEKNDDFRPAKFFCKTDFDLEAIKKEEEKYVELPKFYTFKDEKEKKEVLEANFRKISEEVAEVCNEVLGRNK